MRSFLLRALGGFVQGFFMLVGERVAMLGLNYLRNAHDARQPFYGKPPYEQWPHG